MRLPVVSAAVLAFAVAFPLQNCRAQEPAGEGPLRSSIVEDQAARKLIEAGDARYEAEEVSKAVEVWQSVIERYPRSRYRFVAHMRLGDYFLDRDRAYDRARAQFESVAIEDNRDEEQRAEATLKMGVCFYQAGNYGRCFQVMRDVIEQYPVSKQVNEAYYYIGLGHFRLGHYSRAIEALERVGTTLSSEEGRVEKVEAGKRFFVKIEDADLAALEPGTSVEVKCETTSGDVETVKCFPIGRNVRIVLGSLPTALGKPVPGNGILEVKGDDSLKVTYTDEHTADKQFNRPIARDVEIVGDALVSVTDGAYSESLQGVVLGKSVNVQIVDADRDLSDQADTIPAIARVYRHKTDEEIENELLELAQKEGAAPPAAGSQDAAANIDKFKQIDEVKITLVEARVNRELSSASSVNRPSIGLDDEANPETPPATPVKPETAPEAAPEKTAAPQDDSIHSGVFRTSISLEKADEAVADDNVLQALPGDFVRIIYVDERHMGDGINEVKVQARCIEGNLGDVRVTRAEIGDRELRVQTNLKTANALTNIGNRYKEFGLKSNADAKYQQALGICEDSMKEASALGGKLLEETYVQLWQIYFEMDRLELAAAMAQRLQRDFPNSGFVDDALLQLADVARKQGNLQRAIGIYTRLVSMQDSQLRGEAQYGIAECYEKMAEEAPATSGTQLYDRAFLEYQKVFENFPDSGRVGEAVSKMANYYYRQQDYARAIDTFETVLSNYPDAKFLDVILFNYGRCLYRMNRRAEARQRFDQLIGDYPESPLASDAKKISEALIKASAPAGG